MSSSPDLLCRNTRRAIASTFRPPHYARNDYARNDAACENLQSRPKPIVACANPGLIQIKHRQGGIVLPCEGIMPAQRLAVSSRPGSISHVRSRRLFGRRASSRRASD